MTRRVNGGRNDRFVAASDAGALAMGYYDGSSLPLWKWAREYTLAGDRWGPGTRIPTIIVSPFAKRGYVDHTSYDTTSILKFITRRFSLEPLPGVRSAAGDLSNAFDFGS
jgi:phospholipase C